MRYRLAVFDMDGTILNTLTDLKNALNHALRESGMPERTLDEVRCFVGNGIRLLIERGVPANTPVEKIDRVFDCFNRYYALHCADTTAVYDGINEAIAALRQKGVLTAVVSNKSDYAVQELCPRYFDGLFDYAVGVKEDIPKKPAPDMVEQVMRKLGVSRRDTVYIGDSNVDLQTAANTGIDCLSVDWGFRTREELVAAGASVILSNPTQLIPYIIGE